MEILELEFSRVASGINIMVKTCSNYWNELVVTTSVVCWIAVYANHMTVIFVAYSIG